MKTVVRGLVAPALVIGGNTARGFTFTAIGLGDDPDKTLGAPATFAISDLKQVITLANIANDQLRPSQMTIRHKRFDGESVQTSIGNREFEITAAELATRGQENVAALTEKCVEIGDANSASGK